MLAAEGARADTGQVAQGDAAATDTEAGLLSPRLIVRDSSVFGRWPTAYRYEATIDRDAHTIAATWTNENPGG